MEFVVLETGIFPDRSTLVEALAALPACHTVRRPVMPSSQDDEEGWDRLLQALLAADRIVVV
ncbi:hypothetical protein [Thiobacillus sp.]|uniref:hypothetical protein n=1 Tax=Thiobacillus sp. TaxID=924 RepID=UPI0011DB79A8|nr:hypothetical protein [Thiobacillus sp.]TXH77033.1 MAG: hypothetical protein E6Q82_00580 [Thiobacillus sp.]